jgi:hypothetical protein
MSDLRSAQQWMHDALIFPRRATPDAVGRLLLSSSRLTGVDGLAIYQRGYFQRIAGCMREQFPALCHALGESLFDDFVAGYIRERPPQSYTLYDLGRRFAVYLEESRPDAGLAPEERESWIDFMVDLARFEYQVFIMFDAAGREGKPFATAETPDRVLRLQPAFALGAFRFPVAFYYHAVRQNEAATFPLAAPSFVALVRTDYVTRTIALGEPDYRFLKTMQEGGGVDDAIAAVARHLDVAPGEIRRAWRDRTRQRWLDQGFFIAGDSSS